MLEIVATLVDKVISDQNVFSLLLQCFVESPRVSRSQWPSGTLRTSYAFDALLW